MTTTDWTLTRNAIIAAAYRKLRVSADGQPLTGSQMTAAVEALNAMSKNLQAMEFPLWQSSEELITSVADQADYIIPNNDAMWLSRAWYDDLPLVSISREEHQDLAVTWSGYPAYVLFTRTPTAATITVCPTPAESGKIIKLLLARQFKDWDSASDSTLVPPEWVAALIWGLASSLAPEYGIPGDEQNRLVARFENALANARLAHYDTKTLVATSR